MLNLRLLTTTITDSSTIIAKFSENLIKDISISNISIVSQSLNVPDPEVLKIKISNDTITMTTQPLSSLAVYKLSFFSTDSTIFKSLNGDAVLLEDDVANAKLIVGPVSPDNPFKELINNFLSENIYSVDDDTVIGKLVQSLSKVLAKGLFDIRQAKNDNYLSNTIVDEPKTRLNGPFDRLDEEGAYEVLRVGINKTGASANLDINFTEFPFDPVTLQVTGQTDRLTVDSENSTGKFNINDFILNLTNRFTTKLISAVFTFNDGYSPYTYDIEKFGYQILDSKYDTEFGFTFLTLKDNQIKLNSKIIEDHLFSFNHILYVDVVYENKDLGRVIDPTTVSITTSLSSTREVLPPIVNIFNLKHAPIVNSGGSIPKIGGLTIYDPNQVPGATHPAFTSETPFRFDQLPNKPGQFSVDYATGTVYVFGADKNNDGTGPFPPLITYKYKLTFVQDIDYVYDVDAADIAALPNGSLTDEVAKISFKYEKVLTPNVDYVADVHQEELSERINNSLVALNALRTQNAPITNVFRIFNETSGEIYRVQRWENDIAYFLFNNQPTIKTSTNELVSFETIANELLLVSEILVNGSSVRIFKILLRNNNIVGATGDVIGSSFNSTINFSKSNIFTQEIYFSDTDNETSNINRLDTINQYEIDYQNGIVYVAVSNSQDKDIGSVSYKRGYIVPLFPHIISVDDIYYRFNILDAKEKTLKYLSFSDGSILPDTISKSNEEFLNDDSTLLYQVSGGKVGAFVNAVFSANVSNNVQSIRGLYEFADLKNNQSPINFASAATFSNKVITVNPLSLIEYNIVQYNGTDGYYIDLGTDIFYQSPNISFVLSVKRSSDAAELYIPGTLTLGTPTRAHLTHNSPLIGDAVVVSYSFTINNLSRVVVDYSRGDLLVDYTYLADEIIISYEYGDNVLDFRSSNALSSGDDYFVTYKVGALRDALLKNFGETIDIPIFTTFDTTFARERYRDAVAAALQSFTAGPTVTSIRNIVEIIVHTPPEIIESAFQNWSLGHSLLSREDIATTGDITLLSAKYGNGAFINSDDQSITLPASSNLRLEQGTFSTWIMPQWNGIDNDANLVISALKDGYFLDESEIFIGAAEYHPTYDVNYATGEKTIHLNKLNQINGTPNRNKNGVFIYYDRDLSGTFSRWYIEAVDGYADGYTSTDGYYTINVKTDGKLYDVKSSIIPTPITTSITSGDTKIKLTFDGYRAGMYGITFIADYEHYLLDFGEDINKNRLSIFKDPSGYFNFRVFDNKKNMYGVSADISAWANNELHHIAASWTLNSKNRRDELHLFIDGAEVPNIIRYGTKIAPYLHEKFRTINPEEADGYITKDIVGSNDLITVSGSNVVTSSINFSSYDINPGDLIFIDEVGFNPSGYSITIVGGNTLTLSTTMPLSLPDARFSVNKTSIPVITEIDIYTNIAVSLVHKFADGYDLSTTITSNIVSSIGTNFTTLGVQPGYLIRIISAGFEKHYVILSVSGNSLIINGDAPTTTSSTTFIIYKNEDEEIPGVRALRPDYAITTDGYGNDTLTITNGAKADDIVLINTLGLNHRRIRQRYYVWGNTGTTLDGYVLDGYVTDGYKLFSDSVIGNYLRIFSPFSVAGNYLIDSVSADRHTLLLDTPTPASFSDGYYEINISNIIKTKLPTPISLNATSIYHIILPLMSIGPTNGTLSLGIFTSNNILTDQPTELVNGRTLAVTIAGNNINFSPATHIIIDGYSGASHIIETLSFIAVGTQNTLNKFSFINHITVNGKPINTSKRLLTVEIKEKYSLTIPETNVEHPVIRFSYQVKTGFETLSGTGTTVTDTTKLFTSSDVGNYLHIITPSSDVGYYLITAVSVDHHSLTLSTPVPVIFSGGVGSGTYEILNVSTSRSGFQNGFFIFEKYDQPGQPYNIPQGLYEFDYYTYLGATMNPVSGDIYLGTDFNGTHNINAVIDEVKISGVKLTDTRIGETSSNSITKDFNSVKALKKDVNTLALIHFDKLPFINETDYYITSTHQFVQSGVSVNDNFNKSIYITEAPIVLDNFGILNNKNEGTIEFWVNPIYDTANDPNFRFYFDASGIVSEKTISSARSIVKIAGKASSITSVKLQVGNQQIDFFAGGFIDTDGQTIILNRPLPAPQTPVVVNYTPSGANGDRISIFKDPSGFITFNIRADGIDYQVRSSTYWQKNTWHRIKAQYQINGGKSQDTIRLFVDGFEKGNTLFGSDILFGSGVVFGSTADGDGSGILTDIKFKDNINEIYIGTEFSGQAPAYALIDNLRISNISRPLYKPFGESIDVNYNSNTDIVFPVTEDLYTTLLLDFETLLTKNTDFVQLKNKASGNFDFTVNIFDSLEILKNNNKIKEVLNVLLKTLKPANSRIFVRFQ